MKHLEKSQGHLQRLRADLTSIVERQSIGIAQIQDHTPTLVVGVAKHMAFLGTHTFFLAFLPPLFFAPGDEPKTLALSLVSVLALGVILASVLKDALCIPRPLLSKGVRRETACNSTAQEFGLPSTHSTNAASVAAVLFAFSPSGAFRSIWVLYPVLMGLSRVITGMHSWLDVTAGWTLGAGISAAWLYLLPRLEQWLLSPSTTPSEIISTFAIIPLLLLLQPEPIAACPCFEDSVAFVSVLAGVLIGYWKRFGKFCNPRYDSRDTSSIETNYLTNFFMIMLYRILIGVFVIYTYRKVAKNILVPLLEFLAPLNSEFEAKKKSRTFQLYRFTNKKIIEVVVYFGIAVLAVDILPRFFRFLSV
ncbi:hypothetical protein HDU79_003736 [Rhizoclosmatium sp. JEL0117]|nr:hypothetical protein HDU79_003736 [Rhizoclosmatium sp. JEL0117]